MNENFITIEQGWENVFNCQIPKSIINIDMESNFSYLLPYNLKSKIPRLFLLIKCRKGKKIVKIKIYLEKKNEIKELEDGLASCVKYSEKAELEHDILLSNRPDIYITAYQNGSVYIERREPFFFPWDHIYQYIKKLLSLKIQEIAAILQKNNLKIEIQINKYISIHLSHRETVIHIGGKYSLTMDPSIFIKEGITAKPTSKRRQEYDDYDKWFENVYIEKADTSTEYVDFITAFEIYSKIVKEWADSNYTKPTFTNEIHFYLLGALISHGDHTAKELLRKEIFQHFEQENVSPMLEIFRRKYYSILESDEQRKLFLDFFKRTNGKSYATEFIYYLKKLQTEFKEANELIRSSLFRAYKNGHDDPEEFFTLFYDFEELQFTNLLYLLFEEDSPITTQFKYLISKTQINIDEYRQMLLRFNNLHNKAAKRAIASIITKLTPIKYFEEEKQQITFLTTGVKQTFEETKKYWESQS